MYFGPAACQQTPCPAPCGPGSSLSCPVQLSNYSANYLFTATGFGGAAGPNTCQMGGVNPCPAGYYASSADQYTSCANLCPQPFAVNANFGGDPGAPPVPNPNVPVGGPGSAYYHGPGCFLDGSTNCQIASASLGWGTAGDQSITGQPPNNPLGLSSPIQPYYFRCGSAGNGGTTGCGAPLFHLQWDARIRHGAGEPGRAAPERSARARVPIMCGIVGAPATRATGWWETPTTATGMATGRTS